MKFPWKLGIQILNISLRFKNHFLFSIFLNYIKDSYVGVLSNMKKVLVLLFDIPQLNTQK